MTLQDSRLVASVRDLGVQFADNDLDITGQDAVSSVALSDASTFWIFGHTIEGPFESIRGFELTEVLSNTGALVPHQDLSAGVRQFQYLATPDRKRARQRVTSSRPSSSTGWGWPRPVRTWSSRG